MAIHHRQRSARAFVTNCSAGAAADEVRRHDPLHGSSR
jgi:hypothetical protein